MLRSTLTVMQKGERGLYFPINHRIVDLRTAAGVTVEEASVQSRYRRELRTSFMTGETRQTVPSAWSALERPTHFLSLRLPAKNVLSLRVKKMYDEMLFSHKQYASLLVPLTKLHMTLGVMTIPERDRENKLRLIHECVADVFSTISPLQIRFRGLGTFGAGRVLFIRVVPEADFATLEKAILQLRLAIGGGLNVDMKGNPHDSYVPHVTVAKIRQSQQGQFGKKILMSFWADYQHHDFGDVTFSLVDVCRMKGSGDGYYHTESSIQLLMETVKQKGMLKSMVSEKSDQRTPLSIFMSEKHKMQLREAFDLFDSEGTGRIKAVDVKVALCALGYEVGREELAQLLKHVGGSINDAVDFNDFYCVLLAKMMQRESRAEAVRAFKLIDVDDKGFISVDDLRPIADSLGMDLTDDELAEMVLFAHPSAALGKYKGEARDTLTVSEEEFLKLMGRAHVY